MKEVTYTRSGQKAFICLCAPSRGNAFTAVMRRQLHKAMRRYHEDEEAWIAVVYGEGKDFCTGSVDEQPRALAKAQERSVLWAGGYVETWKPIIAAVQGQCRGEGFDLVLSCDLRVAEESAYFEPDFEERRGAPYVTPVWLLNQIGISGTMEVLWLRQRLDAGRAAQMGLINRIVVPGDIELDAHPGEVEGRLPMQTRKERIVTPQGDALSGAVQLADELLLFAPITRRFHKETAYRSIGVPLSYAQNIEIGPDPFTSEDRIEGTRAFVENRRPSWRNR